MTFRPLPSLPQCSDRLELIFPRAAFDTVLSNPLSTAAIAAMIYVDAVVDDEEPSEDATWARPTTCLWLSLDVYAKSDDASRSDWREAALGGNAKRKVTDLQRRWGLPFFEQPYADNTREGLRDETLPGWVELGAARKRAGLATSSPLGRWALTASFADLFDPGLSGDDLTAAVEAWRKAHMGPGARMKALVAQQRRDASHAVTVMLPGGGGRSRTLEPGMASVILKGVIELWAPARLTDPVVLTISEPGDKIYEADGDILQALGVAIDVGRLLPDALIVDIGTDPSTFWVVEAVATDGPITEARKERLLSWAEEQRIPPGDCRFLTAFTSRNDAPAKKRLKDLASGTFAWYLDEPGHELVWHEIE